MKKNTNRNTAQNLHRTTKAIEDAEIEPKGRVSVKPVQNKT